MAPTLHQQQCIQDTFGIPSAVVAGAGSGKTDTLTRRIAYALVHPDESGVNDINQILAITYTHKAAEELKSRVKQVLDEEATSQNGLSDQALKVDGAWISTIHGMCSRILRENALAFGLDPNFKLAQDEELEILINDALNEIMSQVLYDESFQTERCLFDEYSYDDLASTIRMIIEQAAESPDANPLDSYCILPLFDPVENLLQLVLSVQEVLRRTEDKLSSSSSKQPSNTELSYYQRSLEAVSAVLGLSINENKSQISTASISSTRLQQLNKLDGASLIALAGDFPKLDGRLGIAKEPLEATGLLPKVSFARASLNMQLAIGVCYIKHILNIAERARVLFEQKKRDQSYLDNSDLLALVAKKLEDPAYAAIAERYANQFQLVMVDEFQDTNQMQVDMINLVAGGRAGKLSEKMCVVGDAQQSIYRFRNADLAVFQEYIAQVNESPKGAVIKLEDNFRSHADILAFCKCVFTDVFKDGYLDLLHGRDEEKAASLQGYHVVQAEQGTHIPRRVNVKEIKPEQYGTISERAAQEIAHDFKELCNQGVNPGQMAVLLGAMTNAEVYARALEEVGLKCAITGGTVFRKSADVMLVADLCDAILNPYNTQALASVLTSDLFCLSADDLIMLVDMREGKRGALSDIFTQSSSKDEQDAMPEIASAALQHAVCILQGAMKRVGEESLSSLVTDVLVESGWLYSQNEQGTSRAANVFKALRMLQAIEKESPAQGFGLVQRFRSRLEIAKEAPGVLSAEDDNFVRIMTIHASKGLSIPIVAVAEAGFSSSRSKKLEMFSRLGKTYLVLNASKSLNDLPDSSLVKDAKSDYVKGNVSIQSESDALRILESIGRDANESDAADYYAAIKYLNKKGELEEHQRKLYVAFTRAKDALIVTQKAVGESKRSEDDDLSVAEAVSILAQEALHPTNADDTDDFADSASSYDEESAAINGSGMTQVVSIHTSYPENPAYDLDWQLRYQYFDLQEEAEQAASESDEDERLESDTVGASDTVSAIDVFNTTDASNASEINDVPRTLTVPVFSAETIQEPILVPYRAQWAEGVISASSLKDVTGEYAADIDPEPLDSAALEATEMAHVFDYVDEGEDANEAPALATERGTAFHALCEWVIAHFNEEASLPYPPEERIRAMVRLYGLNAHQERGLQIALQRWLASDAATAAVRHKQMKAEQPFWVQVRPAFEGSNPIVLQGFIDLLCYDTANQGSAYVVDYKTGTGYNTDAKRRHAYELQAMCYAYALLKQGYEEVTLDFVFVDQPTPEDERVPIIERFPQIDDPKWTLEYLQGCILDTLQAAQ